RCNRVENIPNHMAIITTKVDQIQVAQVPNLLALHQELYTMKGVEMRLVLSTILNPSKSQKLKIPRKLKTRKKPLKTMCTVCHTQFGTFSIFLTTRRQRRPWKN